MREKEIGSRPPLGVPIASIVAVLASAGVVVGLLLGASPIAARAAPEREIAAWIEDLKSDDALVRRDARRVLVQRDDESEPVLRKAFPWKQLDVDLSDIGYQLPDLTVFGSVEEGEAFFDQELEKGRKQRVESMSRLVRPGWTKVLREVDFARHRLLLVRTITMPDAKSRNGDRTKVGVEWVRFADEGVLVHLVRERWDHRTGQAWALNNLCLLLPKSDTPVNVGWWDGTIDELVRSVPYRFRRQADQTLALVELRRKGIEGGKPEKGIRAYLASRRDTYQVGDKLDLQAWLQNGTDAPLRVVGSLDGSNEKERYPYLTIRVTDEQGNAVLPPRAGGCANQNAMKEDDAVLLDPGEVMDPYARGFFGNRLVEALQLPKPGKYTVVLEYDSSGEDEKWLRHGPAGDGGLTPAAALLLPEVARVKVEANPLVIVVK